MIDEIITCYAGPRTSSTISQVQCLAELRGLGLAPAGDGKLTFSVTNKLYSNSSSYPRRMFYPTSAGVGESRSPRF
jgi:hypothetical protein